MGAFSPFQRPSNKERKLLVSLYAGDGCGLLDEFGDLLESLESGRSWPRGVGKVSTGSL